MRRPAWYRNIEVYDGDAPLRWRISIQRNGVPLDLTDSLLRAPLIDDDVEVGELNIDRSEEANGILQLTFTEALYNAVGADSEWRLREDTLLRMLLIRGRIIRKDGRPSASNLPVGAVLGLGDGTINVTQQSITLEVNSGNPLTPSQVEALAQVPGLQAAVEALEAAVGTKAALAALDALADMVTAQGAVVDANIVSINATTTAIDAVVASLGTKAAQVALDALVSTVSNQGGTIATHGSQIAATTAALDDKADLVNGLVPTSQIPSIAIGERFNVANEAAMLALENAHIGDIAIRTDINQRFLLVDDVVTDLGSWFNLDDLTGSDVGVVTINGQSGTVVLAKGDIGLGNVDNTSDLAKPISTAVQNALNAKLGLAGGNLAGPLAVAVTSGDAVTIDAQGTASSITKFRRAGVEKAAIYVLNADDVLRVRSHGDLKMTGGGTSNPNQGLTVRANNLVGVQTDSPAQPLHVKGTSRVEHSAGYTVDVTGNTVEFNRSGDSYIDQRGVGGYLKVRMSHSAVADKMAIDIQPNGDVRLIASPVNHIKSATTKEYVDTVNATRTRRYALDPLDTGGARRWVKIASLDGQDDVGGASLAGMLSGNGDYQGLGRETVLIHMAQRGPNVISLKAWAFGTADTLDPIELYTSQISEYVFDLWVKVSDYNRVIDFHLLNSRNSVIDMTTDQATAPGPLSAAYPIIEVTNVVKDSDFFIKSANDSTKQVRLDSGAVTTGTTRQIVFPNASGELALASNHQQLQNKRILPRVVSAGGLTSYTPTISSSASGADLYACNTPIGNFIINAPAGSPSDAEKLIIRVRSGATGYAPTWNAVFIASGITTLPSAALPANKTCTFEFQYDAAVVKWILLTADVVGY